MDDHPLTCECAGCLHGGDYRRGSALAKVRAAWEALLRPTLRDQAARVAAAIGRRPAPGELALYVGTARDLAGVLRIPLGGVPADVVTCVAMARAEAPLAVRFPPDAVALARSFDREAPATLVVVWVEGGDIEIVPLRDVVDTGPEGDRINAPALRGRS